ncbi:hypothetical protein [Nocardia sp. NBC_00511]|uniref:hypothetical protein n=1 Tax=Nocardia sp. NBC_00511 TaxID=2903591 RepID=UPI0030E59D0E
MTTTEDTPATPSEIDEIAPSAVDDESPARATGSASDTDASGVAARPARPRPARRSETRRGGLRGWYTRELAVTRPKLLAAAAAAAVLLAGTGSACGYFAYTRHHAVTEVRASQSRVTDRDAATKAGTDFLTTMFTVNDGSLDRWEQSVLAATTDSMHDQLAQWKTVLQKLVAAHLEMSSTITDSGVVSQAPDAVTVLAVIESTGRTDPGNPQPGTSSSAALIDLRKIDGHWKVQSYGPAGGTPPAATPAPPAVPATGTPSPAPDQSPR